MATGMGLLRAWPRVGVGEDGVAESLYGSVKMWAHLRREGIEVARCTVERVMRANGRQGVRRVTKVRTTVPDPAEDRAPGLVDRRSRVQAPGRLLVAEGGRKRRGDLRGGGHRPALSGTGLLTKPGELADLLLLRVRKHGGPEPVEQGHEAGRRRLTGFRNPPSCGRSRGSGRRAPSP